MRAVVQRVREAWVRIGAAEVARIGPGLLVLAGVAVDDGSADVAFLAQKLAHLRVFAGEDGRLLHLSLLDTGFELLLVSQFTILGDCRKGRRPSLASAAPPDLAEKLYEDLAAALTGHGLKVATGRFRQMMAVGLVNDGPVTLLLDSKKVF
jgi:D-tyrosyl-tRNA(Tyr) deacylase